MDMLKTFWPVLVLPHNVIAQPFSVKTQFQKECSRVWRAENGGKSPLALAEAESQPSVHVSVPGYVSVRVSVRSFARAGDFRGFTPGVGSRP